MPLVIVENKILNELSIKTITIAVVGVFAAISLFRWICTEAKIHRLGGHAPKLKTKFPFGLGFIATSLRNSIEHKEFDGWQNFFGDVALREGRTVGTIEANPGGSRLILTSDPENIKAILATQFHDYGKGKPLYEEWKEFLGDSIFATDGELWHASRQLIRPLFIKDRVSDLHTFEKHVKILIEAISNGGVVGAPGTAVDGVGQGRTVDISDLFFRYTLDAATEFLLGRSVDSLVTMSQPFAVAFSEAQRLQTLYVRTRRPLNYLLSRKSYRSSLKVMNEFVTPYIEETLRLSPAELEMHTKSDTGYTFLHALAGFTRDRRVLRDQLIAILLAGRDTTASTLSWTFYELAKHPEVVAKLRAEIAYTVGPMTPPTYAHLKSMKYLQNTMNETLRIYPVVPFNVRFALRDTTLPRGGGSDGQAPVGVLKDTPIAFSTLLMQRRPDLYPPSFASDPSLSPTNFNPDRWTTWQPHSWRYVPFNGGPRICIGQQFALAEMGYTIVRLLQHFGRLENRMSPEICREPLMKSDIVLSPAAGVHVAFWDAAQKERIDKSKS